MRAAACVALLCVLSPAAADDAAPLEFTPFDLPFTHASAPAGRYRLPEIMGSGVALFDYDNDGDLDAYLVNSEGPSALLRQTSGRFEDVGASAGVSSPGYGMGAAIGDVDNDGDVDLFVTTVGRDRLYLNNGSGSFIDATADSGIVGEAWSTSAALCDVDRDGYLDLYVATYVAPESASGCNTPAGAPDYCPPNVYPGLPDELYLNNGDGTFRAAPPQAIDSRRNRALGVVCADLDGNGAPDFLVANDGEPNHLWLSRGDGTFDERGAAFGIATNLFGESEASMGIALGDLNDDGRLDAFMTHIDRESNTLYASTPQGAMLDATIGARLGFPSVPFTGFGAAFFDADHDGDLDLAVANGRVRKGPVRGAGPLGAYAEPNLLMANAGGVFANACPGSGFCAAAAVSRGLVTGDIDQDGDLDVIVTNSNAAARLYRNETRTTAGWLQIRALDPTLKRDAIGAAVSVETEQGRQIRPVQHATSYLSSRDATVHFGLGRARRAAVSVRWPDGAEERFAVAPINRRVVLRKGTGEQAP